VLTQNREKKIKTKGPKSIPAETSLPAETGRNGRNRPEQAEILAEVEHGGDSYRLACRYEIFRPFRPEQNGLYNIGANWNEKPPYSTLGKISARFGHSDQF
jgi:hypothetical protein